MADEAAGKEQESIPDIAALDLLRKAEEFFWMLQIAAFVLFVDSSLMVARQRNILTFPWADTEWKYEVGPIIVLGLCYSLLVSAILPLLESVASSCVRYAYYIWLGDFARSRETHTRPQNYVRCRELEARADEEQSDYLLAKVNEAKNRSVRINEAKSRAGSRAFRLLVILTLNFYLSSAEARSTIWQLTNFTSTDIFIFGLLLIHLGLAFFCCRSWCRDWFPVRWIEYAPLYNEIQKKEADRRERERVLMRTHDRNDRHF